MELNQGIDCGRSLINIRLALVSCTAVLRAVDKGDEHTEKASDSLLSQSSSMIASSKSWIEEKGGVVKKRVKKRQRAR
jgi:hypothetical protein